MEKLLCPKCRTYQNMIINNDEKIINGKNNEKTRITIKNYTCSVCHIFVKSDEKRGLFIDIKK